METQITYNKRQPAIREKVSTFEAALNSDLLALGRATFYAQLTKGTELENRYAKVLNDKLSSCLENAEGYSFILD